jgi:signal transduction histidine kinase
MRQAEHAPKEGAAMVGTVEATKLTGLVRPGRGYGRLGLFVLFTALLAALVATFAVVVVKSENESRTQSQRQFGDVATLAAQFTGSVFGTSASSGASAAAKTYGSAKIDQAALDAAAKASGAAYFAILDARGHVLAATAGLPKNAIKANSPQILQARAGHAWLSSIVASVGKRGPVIQFAVPFKSATGTRIEVEGAFVAPVTGFLDSYLAKTSTGKHTLAFLLDGDGRVIASSSKTATPGSLPKASGLLAALAHKSQGHYSYSGASRYFVASPVAGASWRVVLVDTTNELYSPLAGSKSWILFAVLGAFAAASLASAAFFARTLSTGAALRRSNGDLTALNSTLEQRVAERTADAEDRARELARSNAELEQFSSVASHDLQEPLRKIRMFGDRLKESAGDTLADEPAADLERMRSAAARMQRLIGDLLDFSRVTHRGKEFAPVDLQRVANEVVSDLEARIVELEGTVDIGSLPTLEADATQMRQLLQNLIGNALKFHRDDEAPHVRVTSEVIEGQVPRFSGEAVAGSRAVITVEDNGIGFDNKHAERIFGPFERLHGRSAYEGTGIGLSIARKIAWRHGGHIEASSKQSSGATFTVTLPLAHTTNNNGGASS